MGCVFLEFITWLIEGSQGLEDFTDARYEEALDGAFDDTFFSVLQSHNGKYAEVRRGVSSWFERLRKKPRCSSMVQDLLRLVQDKMLKANSADRIRAEDLSPQLERILARAKEDTRYLLDGGPAVET